MRWLIDRSKARLVIARMAMFALFCLTFSLNEGCERKSRPDKAVSPISDSRLPGTWDLHADWPSSRFRVKDLSY